MAKKLFIFLDIATFQLKLTSLLGIFINIHYLCILIINKQLNILYIG